MAPCSCSTGPAPSTAPCAPAQVGSATATGGTQKVTIDESSAVIDVAAKLGPAVVKITTGTAGDTSDPFGGAPATGIGSGFIYDANGWILTNRHVVADAQTLSVELKDGRKFEGKVYGIDTLTDLAIVKIDGTDLPVAALGESDGLKIGQLVVAIGSPLGMYSFSVTSGIVSGKGRDVLVDSGTRINNLIQTDAAINPGNSGGPLADAGGNVVGINTAVATDSSGIGFAIPIDIAKPIMAQAVRGEALTRPWIGIRFTSINEQVKEDNKLSVDAGALVTNTGGTGAAIVARQPGRAGRHQGRGHRPLDQRDQDRPGAPAGRAARAVRAQGDGEARGPPRRQDHHGGRHPRDAPRQPVARGRGRPARVRPSGGDGSPRRRPATGRRAGPRACGRAR